MGKKRKRSYDEKMNLFVYACNMKIINELLSIDHEWVMCVCVCCAEITHRNTRGVLTLNAATCFAHSKYIWNERKNCNRKMTICRFREETYSFSGVSGLCVFITCHHFMIDQFYMYVIFRSSKNHRNIKWREISRKTKIYWRSIWETKNMVWNETEEVKAINDKCRQWFYCTDWLFLDWFHFISVVRLESHSNI